MARSPLNIKITGVESTFATLKDKYNSAMMEVDREMAASTEQMATNAKSLFPGGNPAIKGETQKYADIRSKIKSEKNGTSLECLSIFISERNNTKSPDSSGFFYVIISICGIY